VLSNREDVETKLRRIAEKARKDPSCKFTSLFHLMNTELLRGCFEGLRKDAASGIDRVTKEEYGRDLEANLTALVERLHRMSYIPQPVRRVYIQAGEHEAEATGDSGPGRQTGAGGTGADFGGGL